MSRRAAAAALALFGAAPLAAQAPPVDADEALAAAAEAYGPPAPQRKCSTVPQGEEIVVCAEEQEQSQFRLRSDEQAEDDYARETTRMGPFGLPAGLPADFAGPGIFRGPPTASGCVPGLTNCPPPPAYFIDFSQLPEAPPGSDADRVGRGLPPRGDDAGAAPVIPPESASPAELP